MEFITSDLRIAVENFYIGRIYTITFKDSTSITRACIGKGADYVMFQEQAPKMLFTLNMQTAATVDTIEPGTGSGTDDYDNLKNKPKINSVTLSGNKSSSDLGLQDTISDLATIRSGASAGATAVQPAAMQTALAAKQDTISDLDTIRSGASAGATAVQPAALEIALAAKQDTLTTAQLAAVNSGIDSTKVAQIETNKNNILTANDLLAEIIDSGAKNRSTATGGSNVGGAGTIVPDTTIKLPAGDYIFYWKNTSTNVSTVINCYTSDNTRVVNENKANSAVESREITVPQDCVKFNLYCTGINTITDLMICTKAAWTISQKYVPYCPTLAELANQ